MKRRDFLRHASAICAAVTAAAALPREALAEEAGGTNAPPTARYKPGVGRVRIAHEESAKGLRKGDLALVELAGLFRHPKAGQLVAAFVRDGADGKLLVRFYGKQRGGTVTLTKGPRSAPRAYEADDVTVFGPVFCVERDGGPVPVKLNLRDFGRAKGGKR
jgi:hypothetical protein